MTDTELTAIERRAQAATPGPWMWTYDGSSDWSVGPEPDTQGQAVANCHRYRAPFNHDAVFIAHAREDVPALVAEVRKLRAFSEELTNRPELADVVHDLLAKHAIEYHHADFRAHLEAQYDKPTSAASAEDRARADSALRDAIACLRREFGYEAFAKKW